MMSYFTDQFPSICDRLEKELFKDPENSRVFPPDIFCRVGCKNIYKYNIQYILYISNNILNSNKYHVNI